MSEVQTTRVYRLLADGWVWPEHGSPRPIAADTPLWLHTSRKSSLGGYIGTFSYCWVAPGFIGPKGFTFDLKMDLAKALLEENP